MPISALQPFLHNFTAFYIILVAVTFWECDLGRTGMASTLGTCQR